MPEPSVVLSSCMTRTAPLAVDPDLYAVVDEASDGEKFSWTLSMQPAVDGCAFVRLVAPPPPVVFCDWVEPVNGHDPDAAVLLSGTVRLAPVLLSFELEQ